jgi:hypothetical protein
MSLEFMGNIWTIAGLILGGFALISVILMFFVMFQRGKRSLKQKQVVLQISVPKELESGPIVAEQMFSALHGVYRKIGFWKFLRGHTQDSISFEIANIGRTIRFFVSFPSKLRNLVEGQVYAQYPDAEIVEVEDYAVKGKGKDFSYAIGAELTLTDADIYPIKRYTQFEDKLTRIAVDPLAGITSTLTKFNDPVEEAWIQVVVKPLPDKWRIVLVKCVKIITKGVLMEVESFQKAYARAFITRKLWPRVVFFPVYMLFWVRGFFVKAGWNDKRAMENSRAMNDEDIDQQTTMRSHERETDMDAAMDKVVRLLFDVNVRVVYLPKDKDKEASLVKISEIAGSFKQFNQPHLNGFKADNVKFGADVVRKYRQRQVDGGFILNNEELATIFHLPSLTVKTPNITWVKSRKLEPPVDLPVEEETSKEDGFTLVGRTNFRGHTAKFGLKDVDRRRHVYIIGKTGMGKSTLLENMIHSDIVSGKGVGVVDPHGDLADRVLDFVPAHRTNDVILIDPSDRDFPVAFNMLENVDPAYNSIVCSGIVGIFKKLYVDSWGPRLEHILRNTILSLLEYPGTTMLGITRVLQDADFRRKVIAKVDDPIVKAFWLSEFEKMQDRMRIEAISPILNKVGQFLSSSIIRNIVGQPKSAVDLRFAMDKGKIVIVNLSKGKIGEDNSALLGSMIITKFQLDAMSRADIPEKDRKDFYLYVDEFQNFATEAFSTILSEARKYKLNLTMANQYVAQMSDEVKDAVFGNVGSLLSMQVGFDDAEYISQQFGEEVLPADLVGMSKFTAYGRLLIDNMPTNTFSFDTLPPADIEESESRRDKVRKTSRERYATKREIVEDKIMRWSKVD